MHRPSPGLPDLPGGPAPAPTLAERAGGRLLGAVAPTAVLIAAMWVAQFVLIFLGRVIIPGVGLIPRRLAGLDGFELGGVAHEQHLGPGGLGLPGQFGHLRGGHHGGLVHDQQLSGVQGEPGLDGVLLGQARGRGRQHR